MKAYLKYLGLYVLIERYHFHSFPAVLESLDGFITHYPVTMGWNRANITRYPMELFTDIKLWPTGMWQPLPNRGKSSSIFHMYKAVQSIEIQSLHMALKMHKQVASNNQGRRIWALNAHHARSNMFPPILRANDQLGIMSHAQWAICYDLNSRVQWKLLRWGQCLCLSYIISSDKRRKRCMLQKCSLNISRKTSCSPQKNWWTCNFPRHLLIAYIRR